jgi:hypothetical protein
MLRVSAQAGIFSPLLQLIGQFGQAHLLKAFPVVGGVATIILTKTL